MLHTDKQNRRSTLRVQTFLIVVDHYTHIALNLDQPGLYQLDNIYALMNAAPIGGEVNPKGSGSLPALH